MIFTDKADAEKLKAKLSQKGKKKYEVVQVGHGWEVRAIVEAVAPFVDQPEEELVATEDQDTDALAYAKKIGFKPVKKPESDPIAYTLGGMFKDLGVDKLQLGTKVIDVNDLDMPAEKAAEPPKPKEPKKSLLELQKGFIKMEDAEKPESLSKAILKFGGSMTGSMKGKGPNIQQLPNATLKTEVSDQITLPDHAKHWNTAKLLAVSKFQHNMHGHLSALGLAKGMIGLTFDEVMASAMKFMKMPEFVSLISPEFMTQAMFVYTQGNVETSLQANKDAAHAFFKSGKNGGLIFKDFAGEAVLPQIFSKERVMAWVAMQLLMQQKSNAVQLWLVRPKEAFTLCITSKGVFGNCDTSKFGSYGISVGGKGYAQKTGAGYKVLIHDMWINLPNPAVSDFEYNLLQATMELRFTSVGAFALGLLPESDLMIPCS